MAKIERAMDAASRFCVDRIAETAKGGKIIMFLKTFLLVGSAFNSEKSLQLLTYSILS